LATKHCLLCVLLLLLLLFVDGVVAAGAGSNYFSILHNTSSIHFASVRPSIARTAQFIVLFRSIFFYLLADGGGGGYTRGSPSTKRFFWV
jgi:hypothetical protein